MLEGINIISPEVTKDVTVSIFILICVIACFVMFWSIWLLKIGFNMTKLIPHKLFKIIFNSLDIVYTTKYTVTISDEVSYNEFTKKYEIIEYNKENNTYVIREKENVD